MFEVGCITCHGRAAGGVEGRGPSLINVGGASVEFQVGTGRMPLARQEAQAMRKPPQYTDEQVRQLAAYIQSLGTGPVVPDNVNALTEDADLARGGELFRINCSQCHAFGGGGGALTSGKYAPSLHPASDRIIYAAMLSGPQNMPWPYRGVRGGSTLVTESQ
ncbi:c-type cytochrome [Micromonospora sp. KC723]|nr:c-type cytochrome [Micromonospora sp. KC723]